MNRIFKEAREKYKPRTIKTLFITEAPPSAESNRYFYLEQVRKGDSLFLEMMKVLFPEEVAAFDTVKSLRAEKTYFLERMQEEGYFLMHAYDEPLPGTTAAFRTRKYKEHLPELIKSILTIATPATPVVLVSAVVYHAISEPLKNSGFRMIQDAQIEYPNSGQQLNFRRKLMPLLRQHQLLAAPL